MNLAVHDEPLSKRITMGDQSCIVGLTHMQGAERLTGLRDFYLQNSQGFVSITLRASFKHIKSYHDSALIMERSSFRSPTVVVLCTSPGSCLPTLCL
ncbi:hypothetical protein BD779DRAFT_1545959 [Infundibulicybe gibba]|nr:hypothetical protein BD779DRAFT_1545959 [Infundibulicybe gibba]